MDHDEAEQAGDEARFDSAEVLDFCTYSEMHLRREAGVEIVPKGRGVAKPV